MTNSTRGLIATICGFAAVGLALITLFYWGAIQGFTFDFSQIDTVLRVLIILTVIFLAAYVLISPQSLGVTAGKRSNRLAANALVVSLVAIAIAIAVNIIFANVPSVRADVTAGQQFTLSQQTISVLDAIDKGSANIQAVAFVQSGDATTSRQATDLLGQYVARTHKISYQVVDPNNNPAQAVAFGVSSYGQVAFVDSVTKKHELAASISESDLTSAIVRLLQNTTYTVAFLTGHGERDIASTDPTGYSQVDQTLVTSNYHVISWSLVTSPTITVAQASALVIAAPANPLTSKEVAAIQAYLDSGGHLMVIMDPNMSAAAQKPLHDLLLQYGIEPVEGIIWDQASAATAQDYSVLAVNSYPDNPVTKALASGKLYTFFQASLGFRETAPTKQGFTVTPVVKSIGVAPAGWLETNITDTTHAPSYNAGTDLPGPVDIAVLSAPAATTPVTATTTTTTTRVLAIGDSDFATNNTLQTVAQQVPISNGDFFNNSVSWLVGQSELVSIAPKTGTGTRTILLDAGQKSLVFISSVLGLPLLVALAGVAMWWRRR